MAELSDIRLELDKLDDELINLFIKRMSLTDEVAKIKIRDGLPLFHKGREDEILNRLSEGLDSEMAEYVKSLYQKIFEISRTRQQSIMNENDYKG